MKIKCITLIGKKQSKNRGCKLPKDKKISKDKKVTKTKKPNREELVSQILNIFGMIGSY